ncbi:MAG TPA: isocitrate lyase/phosphoenolpyruvate mutase family protein [Usitatibacter sp.]|nr:isocitrate lyase/phosphoenolpyruvate mutase family protein [Usitatibacter sp.]
MRGVPVAADRRARFRALHERGCFVLPNPWDAGSAKLLARMGFQALATTSAGYAWSQGLPDGEVVTREMVLEHLRVIVAATGLPVNADFESGYAKDAQGVAQSVRMAIDTGVAGISIEDSTGDAANPVRTVEDALARLRAARAAIDESKSGVMLIGRAENFFLGRPDIEDTVARLKAYSQAGADCLYAPGIKTREHIAAVVKAVAPKPVNLLIGGTSELTVKDAQVLGVRRISVGGALARAAWGGFFRAARALADEGRFDGFAGATAGKELNEAFGGG